MTATPIPRTLALTLYGDLDVSVIDELPPGRTPARTALLREGQGQRVVRAVRETLERGEQVYVVYPLVEESEKVDLRAATEQAERIRAAFRGRARRPGARPARRRRAGRGDGALRAGETQILVSTTVIEVGVDVANATLMVVEHAERFGLSQLHQLRGRVGRGERPGSACSWRAAAARTARRASRAMLETTDGFAHRRRGPAHPRPRRVPRHAPARLAAGPALRRPGARREARRVAREAARDIVRRDPGLRRSPRAGAGSAIALG